MEWYVIVDGVRRGPMSKASVMRLIEIGVVTSSTPVRKTGMPGWLQVGHIRDFEPERPATAPLPVVLPSVEETQSSWWQRLRRIWQR